MIKSKWEHLFALTPKQKEVAAYILMQETVDIKKWAKDLNLTVGNLQNHLYILRDKYDVLTNKELLEQIKSKGIELSNF